MRTFWSHWSDYCLIRPLSPLYSFWGVRVSPPWHYCIFFLLVYCHFLSPLCMISSCSSCSHTFITAILDENAHKVRTHYAFPSCTRGNRARGEKRDLPEVKWGFYGKVNNWTYRSFHFHEQPHSMLPFIWTGRWSSGNTCIKKVAASLC